MGISFAHIAPTKYLFYLMNQPVHLLLAHLIEEDEAYRNFYISLKKKNPNVFYHMDCSTFEMFKRGSSMYPSGKLIEMGKMVQANSIVMSDYPKEDWRKTVDAAKDLIPEFKQAGFKTFFCPQSKLGDLNGLMSSFEWAIGRADVDYIGVSILACPIAMGVDESTYEGGKRSESFRMQRYLARWAIFQELNKRSMLRGTLKQFHCLGMTEGPREIELLKPFSKHIFSWDSSIAVWRGINNLGFDNSPTGCKDGKFELEVDFQYPLESIVDKHIQIMDNINMINNMCED